VQVLRRKGGGLIGLYNKREVGEWQWRREKRCLVENKFASGYELLLQLYKLDDIARNIYTTRAYIARNKERKRLLPAYTRATLDMPSSPRYALLYSR
jgi:hypothetical protein